MKLDKISLLLLGALTLASCSDIDEQYPEGGNLLADQKQESQDAVPSRMDATLSGMYTMMGAPYAVYGSRSARADDSVLSLLPFLWIWRVLMQHLPTMVTTGSLQPVHTQPVIQTMPIHICDIQCLIDRLVWLMRLSIL